MLDSDLLTSPLEQVLSTWGTGVDRLSVRTDVSGEDAEST